jgi:EAL domain-containing protein (putative c-di-GMP-specific phosphodiesterase class I)/GGDEF domain-containing protein
MNLCGLIDDKALRERVTLLAADAGWSCWVSDDLALLQRVLDTSHSPADLILTDSRTHVAALQTSAGRAPVVLLAAAADAADPAFSRIDPTLPDAELVMSFRTCVNARRFRERFADLDRQEPITNLPRHDELLAGLARHAGARMGLLVIQVDHADHLYNHLDPVSRSDLLGVLSEQVRRALPPAALLGFYDPSCFVAALPGFAAEQVAAAAKETVAAMRGPLYFKGGVLHITVSVGYGDEALFGDAQRLWSQTWRAMRRALAQHGDRAVGCERIDVAERLPQALAREEFSLVLQPQIGVDGERLAGAEVLLRWQGLEVGELSPSQFIPVAESRGYMARIGDWVLENACRAAATWLENRIDPVRLGINVSPQQFNKGTIVAQIERFRAERWLDPSLLEIEIPHEAMLQLVDAHREQLYRLRDLGVRFALDHLGSGLLDAARLLRCPADTLKIDRALVERLDVDVHARELVEGICQLGRRFQLRVVAVGVERESQLSILRQAGCTDAQGYLFSPPVSLARFGDLLSGVHGRHHPARKSG